MSDQNVGHDQDTPPEPMPQSQHGLGGGFISPEATPPGIPQPQPAAEDREVDPNEALTQAQAQPNAVQTTPAQEQPDEPEDVLDVLQPRVEPQTWHFGPEDMPLEYVQRPMSFIGRMQWFALVGGVLDKAMSGEGGVSVNDLISAPGNRSGQMSIADFRDADTFIRAIGKVITHAPEFLLDSYCIWLGVPDHQKPFVKEIMALPESEGGLTDDQGLGMIETFIDQNYDALADFFGGKIANLQRRVKERQEARKTRGRVRA